MTAAKENERAFADGGPVAASLPRVFVDDAPSGAPPSKENGAMSGSSKPEVEASTSSTSALLSKVSRYQALLELTGVIIAANDIETVGLELARRLKYIVDVFSWRYICFDGDPEDPDDPRPVTLVIEGYQGRATVQNTTPEQLSCLERELWRDRKSRILCGDAMQGALEQLPEHFRRKDLEQIAVNTLVEDGKTQALYLFCKRRQPFTELDTKCLAAAGEFFHNKIHMLWERQKLRDLELAYLQQELMLRQSERLATVGRMSAGMAHELNNPASAARHGAQHLRKILDLLEEAQFALGDAGPTREQRHAVAVFKREAMERWNDRSSLDPITRGDLEREFEEWLDRLGMPDPWQHAATFVEVGLGLADLQGLTSDFEPSAMPLVVDCVGRRLEAFIILEDIARGTGRISEVVKALKGYSFMDQAPVQLVDIREGIDNTLVMLGSRLSDRIDITRDYEDPLPRVLGYGSELNQVWTNLIDNAVSAMGGEGELELKAHREDGWVVVEVADDGPGIPNEDHAKVFDPFYTTKAPGEGTGLGLSISHGIVVEKHRGEISFDSKPGATRFVVRLPITGEAEFKEEAGETAG